MAPPKLCPTRFIDHNFGFRITPQDVMHPYFNFFNDSYYMPRKWCAQSVKDFGSSIENDKEKFKVMLDVQHFNDDELSVKVTDNEVIIEGKHDERQDDYCFVSRHFRRRYVLPADCPAENVSSSLSSDGILIVEAAKESKNVKNIEKIVQIKTNELSPKVEQKSSEIIETDLKKKTEDIINNNNIQMMIREDHSRLLKPELLGSTVKEVSEKILNTGKEELDIIKKNEKSNVTSLLEESLRESSANCKISSKLGQVNTDMKKSSEMEELFSQSSLKTSRQGIAGTSADSLGQSMQTMAIKEYLDEASMSSKSEISSYKISTESQESRETYTSVSSGLKTTSEELMKDIISAEMKDAAENL